MGKGKEDYGRDNYGRRIAAAVSSVLDAAIADFESGLTTSVRVQAKGEVLGDFGTSFEVQLQCLRAGPRGGQGPDYSLYGFRAVRSGYLYLDRTVRGFEEIEQRPETSTEEGARCWVTTFIG
jgi:hypothetical protein